MHSLQEEAQAATESLRPAHTWVPWVTVNRRPINAKQLGEAALIKRRVCDAFKGPRCASAYLWTSAYSSLRSSVAV